MKEGRNSRKKSTGITLIALVVTIVVLLILAGISINTILGDNGIISRSKDAKERTEYAQEQEKVKYAVVDAFNIENTTIQTEDLKNALKKEFNLSDVEIDNRLETKSDDGPWIFTGDKGKHEIDENGSVSKKLESGLYDLEDNQIYDWNELLKKGYITVTNGVLTTGYSDYANPHSEDLVGKLVIDDSVTEIGENGLRKLKKLEKIVLPENIILDEYAMSEIGINGIGPKGSGASLELPKSLKRIESNAFYSCEELTSVKLDEKIEEIGKTAFAYCKKLEIWVPNTIKKVESWAFVGTSVVCYLGDLSTENWCSEDTFHKYNAIGICQICNYHKYASNNEITLNKDNAYIVGYKKNETEELNIPEQVEFEGKQYTIVGIDKSTFNYDSKIRKVIIPNTVKSIGEYVLYECSNLEEVYVPASATDIKNAFVSRCNSLKKIDIADGNTRYMDIDGVCYSKDGRILIAYPPAKDCTDFVIPSKVEQLGEWCFTATNVNKIIIPETVKKIGGETFYKCKNLTDLVINANCTEIPAMLCYECQNLKSVTMSDTITSILGSAFKNCYSMTEIKLSNKLEKIGYTAFKDCGRLKTITLPATVKELGGMALYSWNLNVNFENYLNLKIIGDYALAKCIINDENAKEYILSINSTALEEPGMTGGAWNSESYVFDI